VAVEGGANVVLPTEDLGNGGYNTWFVYYLHNLLSGTLHQELPPPPEPEWPKDAYPPQMSAPQPSEEELERRRKLREEGERVKKLPKVPRADCVKGQCDVFAKAELKRRRKNGECCELIQYQSRLLVTGRFGSIWTQVGLFGPDSISGNGNHVGVICGEGKTPRDISDIINDKSTVYDNNIPTGVSGYYWINGAYFVEDPKTGDYVTFLKSHMNKTGIIKIDGKLP
jgi:hypothetical protein